MLDRKTFLVGRVPDKIWHQRHFTRRIRRDISLVCNTSVQYYDGDHLLEGIASEQRASRSEASRLLHGLDFLIRPLTKGPPQSLLNLCSG